MMPNFKSVIAFSCKITLKFVLRSDIGFFVVKYLKNERTYLRNSTAMSNFWYFYVRRLVGNFAIFFTRKQMVAQKCRKML